MTTYEKGRRNGTITAATSGTKKPKQKEGVGGGGGGIT